MCRIKCSVVSLNEKPGSGLGHAGLGYPDRSFDGGGQKAGHLGRKYVNKLGAWGQYK
jgi:hypothetical protein